VGLLFVAFVEIIVSFKSTSLAIIEGGEAKKIEPQFWGLFS